VAGEYQCDPGSGVIHLYFLQRGNVKDTDESTHANDACSTKAMAYAAILQEVMR